MGHLRHLYHFIEEHMGQLRPRPILRIGPSDLNGAPEDPGDAGGSEWLPELREMLKSVIEVSQPSFSPCSASLPSHPSLPPLQILGLWRLLSEHQFFLLARRLSPEFSELLRCTTFKHLLSFSSSRPLLLALISALLEHYLSDSASVDAISVKLQETCPSFFAAEDAYCAKANELVQFATAQLPGPPNGNAAESNNSNSVTQALSEQERQSALAGEAAVRSLLTLLAAFSPGALSFQRPCRSTSALGRPSIWRTFCPVYELPRTTRASLSCACGRLLRATPRTAPSCTCEKAGRPIARRKRALFKAATTPMPR